MSKKPALVSMFRKKNSGSIILMVLSGISQAASIAYAGTFMAKAVKAKSLKDVSIWEKIFAVTTVLSAILDVISSREDGCCSKEAGL